MLCSVVEIYQSIEVLVKFLVFQRPAFYKDDVLFSSAQSYLSDADFLMPVLMKSVMSVKH
jgi:hypothetical protein